MIGGPMLSCNERKRRQDCVLAALTQAGEWARAAKLIHLTGLTYETLNPVLEALSHAGLIKRESETRQARWGLVGLSTREQAARLEALEQQKINREQNRIARECRKDGLESDEHKVWLETVARQKAWRKQMVFLENRR